MTIDAAVLIGEGPDSLEGTKVTTPAGTDLFREGVVISDPDVAEARAKITNTSPAADAYGLAVRVIGGVVVGSEVEIKNDIGNPVPVSGSVSVSNFPATQQISGTVALDATSLAALETINVGNTVAVSATDLDIRNLSSAQDSVTVTGSVTSTVSGTVEITNDVGNPIPVSGTVAVTDGGGSITVDGSVSAAVTGTVSVNNFPATQTVSATDLDIRNLSSAQDSVSVTGSVNVGNFPATQQVAGTVTANLGTLNGAATAAKQLPDNHQVQVSNFPATQAVSGTVTVTATDLDIRNLSSAQDNIRAFDSTDSEYLRIATSVTTAGDTTLVTPSAGKRIRLQWVYAINDPTASIATKLTIKLGTAVQYVAWAISKRQQLTGAVDAPLVINLSAAGDVAVTVFYQEV